MSELTIEQLKTVIRNLLPLAEQAYQMNADIERFAVLPEDAQCKLSSKLDEEYQIIEDAKALI